MSQKEMQKLTTARIKGDDKRRAIAKASGPTTGTEARSREKAKANAPTLRKGKPAQAKSTSETMGREPKWRTIDGKQYITRVPSTVKRKAASRTAITPRKRRHAERPRRRAPGSGRR